MRAAVCYEHGQPLVIEEINLIEPKGTQVKVKIGACAICHSDIHYIEGAWKGKLPAVFGHEAAGEVVEVGRNARALCVGDRVIVTLIQSCGHCFYCDQGEPVMCHKAVARDSNQVLSLSDGTPVIQGLKTAGFAEYVVVDESQVAKLPHDIRLDSASLLACGVITGVGAVTNTAKVRPGSSVVVLGTGGVGLNAIQGARLCGAQPIIAVDIQTEKLKAARYFGATHGLLANDKTFREQVFALTHGRGADYVFVTVGAKAAIDQSYDLIRRGGMGVIVGMPAVDVKSEFYPLRLSGQVQTIQGSFMGQTKLTTDIPWLLEHYRQDRLKLDELISNRYPLEQINEAIEETLTGTSLRNVIVMDEQL